MMGVPWQEAMERARAAADAAGYTREMARRRRYRYQMEFDIPNDLAEVVELECIPSGRSSHVRVTFDGTEDAKARICDVVASLPSQRRSYRMSYEPQEGGDGVGGD